MSPQNSHVNVSKLLVRFGSLEFYNVILNWWSVKIWHWVKQTNKHNCTAYVDTPTDALNIEGLDCLPVSKR